MVDTLEELDLDLDVLWEFCERFKVKFVRAEMTFESGVLEPMYFFSDNLGGYTIQGIRASLERTQKI
jgi:hypothetical protein